MTRDTLQKQLGCLIVTGTLGGIHEAEHVEFVEGGEAYEQEVPDHEDDAVPAVQLPTIGVSGEHQEHHRGEQRESGVSETWAENRVDHEKNEETAYKVETIGISVHNKRKRSSKPLQKK